MLQCTGRFAGRPVSIYAALGLFNSPYPDVYRSLNYRHREPDVYYFLSHRTIFRYATCATLGITFVITEHFVRCVLYCAELCDTNDYKFFFLYSFEYEYILDMLTISQCVSGHSPQQILMYTT